MNAEERAKDVAQRIAFATRDILYKKDEQSIMRQRIAEAIQAAEREAVEKCLSYIETKWMDPDGKLIVVDGQDFLDDVRSALIEQGEG